MSVKEKMKFKVGNLVEQIISPRKIGLLVSYRPVGTPMLGGNSSFYAWFDILQGDSLGTISQDSLEKLFKVIE